MARKGTVRVLGSGNQLLAPLLRDVVVEVIVQAAPDRSAPTGTFELAGPDTLTATEVARVVNRGDVRATAARFGVTLRSVRDVWPTLPPRGER